MLTNSGESSSDIDAILAEKSVSGERIFASPLARRLARERGVDPRSLAGSGPGGPTQQPTSAAVMKVADENTFGGS